MKNGTNNIKTPVTQEDIHAYERGWAEEMVNIWKEKIIHYRIRHTGALYNSVQATSFGGSSSISPIQRPHYITSSYTYQFFEKNIFCIVLRVKDC